MRRQHPSTQRATRTHAVVLAASILAPLLIMTSPAPAQAQLENIKISEFDIVDSRKSTHQRELILTLVARRFGQRISGKELQDLGLLQRLLDNQYIKREQVFEQQALGLVMGDIMAAQLGLAWIVIDDATGHSRALRYKKTDNFFFPITMISKQLQFDRAADIRATYTSIEDEIKKLNEKHRHDYGIGNRPTPPTPAEMKAWRKANL